MKYYYYSHEQATITHEDWPENHWQHDSCIGPSFKEIKAHAIEDLQGQIKELRAALKVVQSLRESDVQPTPK